MVNTAFAFKFTTPCKLASKCGIYHLCFWFTPSLHFFASYLHRVNLCKSNFSCSASRDNLCARSSCEKYFSTRVMSTLLDISCLMVMLCTELKQPVSLNGLMLLHNCFCLYMLYICDYSTQSLAIVMSDQHLASRALLFLARFWHTWKRLCMNRVSFTCCSDKLSNPWL